MIKRKEKHSRGAIAVNKRMKEIDKADKNKK